MSWRSPGLQEGRKQQSPHCQTAGLLLLTRAVCCSYQQTAHGGQHCQQGQSCQSLAAGLGVSATANSQPPQSYSLHHPSRPLLSSQVCVHRVVVFGHLHDELLDWHNICITQQVLSSCLTVHHTSLLSVAVAVADMYVYLQALSACSWSV